MIPQRASEIANIAHEHDVDKSGHSYIEHVEGVVNGVAAYVSNNFRNNKPLLEGLYDDHIVVAWLHDVIEDHPDTMSEYWDELNQIQKQSLIFMEHEDNVPYLDYIDVLKHDDIARIVKIADIENNMSRLENLDIDTQDRLMKKYIPALAELLRIEGE